MLKYFAALPLVKVSVSTRAGLIVDPSRVLTGIWPGEARTACAFTGSEASVAADAVLLVTARLPGDGLFLALRERQGEWPASGSGR